MPAPTRPTSNRHGAALAKAAPAHLANLRVKHIGGADAGSFALAQSRLAGQLESLALSDNRFSAEAAMALANAEWPRLKSLELYGIPHLPVEVTWRPQTNASCAPAFAHADLIFF